MTRDISSNRKKANNTRSRVKTGKLFTITNGDGYVVIVVAIIFTTTHCRSRSRPLHVLLDLAGEPLHALVQALAGDGVGGADVPGLVHDALQPQGLRDLDGAHGVAGVHLVGEEQDGDLAGTDVLETVIKLICQHFCGVLFRQIAIFNVIQK